MIFLMMASLYFDLHLFQLSGYKSIDFLLSLFKRKMFWITNVLSILLFFPFDIHIKIFILACFKLYPRSIHKKLVFTPRLLRLYFISLLLSLAFFKTPLIPFIFSFALVIIGNFVAYPFERTIRVKFINKAKKKKFSGLTIGITGSYGKTSTKNILYSILLTKFSCLKTPKSYNTPLGISKVINQDLSDIYDIFICEMGASHKADIKELMDLWMPTYGILTSVGPQHLRTFKTMEAIITEKERIKEAKKGYVSYDEMHYPPYDICSSIEGLSFKLFDEKELEIKCKMIGTHHAYNIALCYEMAKILGLNKEEIIEAISTLENEEHRLKRIDIKEAIILDDSFNSNPIGALNAISICKEAIGRKIIITPGFVELGREEKKHEAILAEEIKQTFTDILIVKNRRLAKQISNSLFFKTFKEAYQYAIKKQNPKVILIENDLPDNY